MISDGFRRTYYAWLKTNIGVYYKSPLNCGSKERAEYTARYWKSVYSFVTETGITEVVK